MRNVENILKNQGEKVRVTQSDETTETFAVIQPMNRRWKTYLSGERTCSGILNNNHYYMMASSELSLNQTAGGTVECEDKTYYIRSCGDFKVKGKKLYVWAVLAARTEPAEDDYD